MSIKCLVSLLMHRIVLVPLQIQGDGQNIGISVQGPISQVKYITILVGVKKGCVLMQTVATCPSCQDKLQVKS